MSPHDEQTNDQNDDFFSFPVEPDEEEAILSFDRLREAFAGLSEEKADSSGSFVRFEENSQSQRDSSDAFQSRDDIRDGDDEYASGDEHCREYGTGKIAGNNDTQETVFGDAEPESGVAENEFDENGEPYESIVALDEERNELSPRTIFEAMLFVGDRDNKPLTPEQAAELMRNVSPDELIEIVHELNGEYARTGSPYHIIREGNGYRMILRPEFESVRSRFYSKTREAKLSQTAIDVLAVVAYKQPITADDVQKYRKSPSNSILQQLVRRGLIDAQKILSEKKSVTLYRTTDRFLKLFQIESLDDLPMAEDIDFR